jgi:hypothetical protein
VVNARPAAAPIGPVIDGCIVRLDRE